MLSRPVFGLEVVQKRAEMETLFWHHLFWRHLAPCAAAERATLLQCSNVTAPYTRRDFLFSQ